MKIEGYRTRIIDQTIENYMETFGAVLLEGPKWCGKTWSGKNATNSNIFLSDPKGNFNNRRLAVTDPEIVLEGERPRLIDEWQEVPQIFDAVRGKVDDTPLKGLFILTGSATINKNRYIHTGTGRIAHLRMRPMSLYESGYSDGKVSLKDICFNNAKNHITGEVSLKTLISYILIGGWPATLGMNINQGMLVSKEYIKSVLNEDIYKTDETKRDKHKVELLLKSLARNEATTATNKTLKKDIIEKDHDDIDADTIKDYLNLLNNLFLLENIPPYSQNIRSSLRIKQSEKRHFTDPSLPSALLNLSEDKLLNDLELLGFLFESMVERDLLTYTDSFNAKLYHYQDYSGKEMDGVIELDDGSWCGVEIKLGANEIDDGANNLLKINDSIVKDGGKSAKSLIVICGLTSAAYKREDGVYVVPITSLKD